MKIRFLVFATAFLLLAPSLAAQYGYHFGRNKVQYEQFDWHRLETPHLDVYHYPEMQELAEYGAAFAETVYKELENRFQFSLNDKIPIIFYSSNLHFKQTNITPGFIPDGVGGFFEFLKGRVVIPSNGDLHRFRRVIRHELVHVFTFNKLSRVFRDHRKVNSRPPPLWFTEGLAEYWSGEPDFQHEMMLRDAVASNYLIPLEDMWRIQGSYLMYKQGEAIFRFISQTYGEEKILQLVENIWIEKDFNDVMSLTLQEDFREIARKWDLWIRKQYLPMLKDTDPPSHVTKPLAAAGFSAKPAYYQGKDGSKKVVFVGNKGGYTNIFQVPVDSSYAPQSLPKILVHGERSEQFEAFHALESRMDVSVDGNLAFVTKSGAQDVIHILDVEKNDLLSTHRFNDLIAVYSPSWDPTGTKLVFSGIERSGYADIFTYDLETQTLRKITNDVFDDRDPDWSPDGRFLVFSSDRSAVGAEQAYNVFSHDLQTDDLQYVTYGPRFDFSPRWSEDGRWVIFSSSKRNPDGKFSAQDIWLADMSRKPGQLSEIALVDSAPDPEDLTRFEGDEQRSLLQLTRLTSAAYDPVITPDKRVLFGAFEHMRFTVRDLGPLDSLLANVKSTEKVSVRHDLPTWEFERLIAEEEGEIERLQYRRRYSLDAAATQVSQNALWGTSGGGYIAFSDLMGDDHWQVYLYNSSGTRNDFLRSLSAAVTRFQFRRRTNIAYGLYRFGGLRYDLTDPDASSVFPVFWENLLGGYGAISYPVSFFKRLDLSTSLTWSDKNIQARGIERKALLLSNSFSFVHDNTLFGMNGPVQGSRANLTIGYTTDVKYSNVNYYTAIADIRQYWRLSRDVTFASRAMGRVNIGKEARLFYLGGSWDLRGFGLFDVRGRKNWFTSHELRFPVIKNPTIALPFLEPFGLATVRGALFFDAAHAWNDGYRDRAKQIFAGETVGATGAGLRANLFGGLVLRYDVGFQFYEDFKESRFFRQFFFGWDF